MLTASRIGFRIVIFTACAWLILGMLLRISGVRDRYDELRLVYYTTPWAVHVVGFAALAVIGRVTRWRIIAGVVAIASLIAWIDASWQFHRPETHSSDEIRVMLWNVANNKAKIPEIAAHIRAQSPDIIGFAEAGNHFSNKEKWKVEFPDYQIVRLRGQMLCLSRTPLGLNDHGSLGNGSWFGITTTIVNGRKVRVLQADINARLLRSRRTALRNLVEKVQSNGDDPLIIMGDLNTPRESHYLDAIRGTFQHAFETRGSGYAETWPIPVPVLSLDQIWLSKDFEVLQCEQGWTRRSDHRPVLVRLRLR